MLWLRPTSLARVQIRNKTAKFKPKIARTHQLKTPSILALDHFDFYYAPLFGKRWPSIRLGLLSPHRYVAVMNTMSRNWKAHEEILADMGAVEVLDALRGQTSDERVEERRRRKEASAADDTKNIFKQLDAQNSAASKSDDQRATDVRTSERSAAGIHEFHESRGELTTGLLQMNKSDSSKTNHAILADHEGRIPRRDSFIRYPRNLHVRCFDRAVLLDFPAPMKDDAGVPSFWLLDGGSLVPVLALGLQPHDSLLDICAAPGGKSLLALLTGLPEKVVCNDFKLARLGQLKRALTTYVPDEQAADKVVLKRKDAGDLGAWDELNAYDKVLADVPCTTDRFSLATDAGNVFSPSSAQLRLNLPDLQTNILVNSLRAVKVGGSVVYSTCTLSPSQNETVVENAVSIAKQQFGIEVVEESLSQMVAHLSASSLFRFHPTSIGALVVPFLPSNFGPMFVCKLSRLL